MSRALPFPSKVSDFLYRIYAMQDVSSLVHALCEELPRIIPADNATVGHYHSETRTVSSVCSARPFSCIDFLPEAIAEGVLSAHPFWNHVLDPAMPLKIISDMLSARQWLNHPFYRELLAEDGVLDHMNIEIGESPRSFTTVGVMRSSRGYSEVDRATLLLLKPHIAQAFRNARVAEMCSLSGVDGDEGRGSMLRVTAVGELEDVPLKSGGGHPVPPPVRKWVHKQVAWLNRGVVDQAIEPFIWEQGHRRMSFRLQRQWGRPGYLLSFCLIREKATPRLTQREKEVMRWLAEGKSAPEIAIILGLSAHTVKDYIKQIYHKLGVENRMSAVRAWIAMRACENEV